MNDLALIAGSFGRIGSLEKIMPEYLRYTERTMDHSVRGAVGMLKTARVSRDPALLHSLPDDEIFASIIVTREDESQSELSEFYGVLIFKPLDGVRWKDQIAGIKAKPTMFEMINPVKMESNTDYAFYAQRAIQTRSRKRRRL